MNLGTERYTLSSNQLFWAFQFAGWLGFALLTYFSITLMLDQHGAYVAHPFVQSAIGIVVSWPMRSVYRYTWEWGILARMLVIVVTVLVFSLIWTILRLDVFIRMTGEELEYLEELSVWFFTGVLVFLGWSGLYHGFRYYRLLQDEHETLLRTEREKQAESLKREYAERLAQESQLKMLRYQLNPHFLFNTMNAITSLINSGRNAEARGMVDSLSEFLREALQGDPLRRVTLREEIQALENYLGIEKFRFGDRLDIKIRLVDADQDFPVPGLLLQPLAENVIKHAVRPTSKKVTLSVLVRPFENGLEIEVSDTGPGISGLESGQLPGEGMGLRNVRERLKNMYGDAASFQLKPAADGGLRVIMQIPEEREHSGQELAYG